MITLDTTITTSELVTIGLSAIGGIGAWFTLRANAANTAARQAETEKSVADLKIEIAAAKLHIAEHFVKRDEIEKLEDRLGKLLSGLIDGIGRRMETAEHQLRNIDTKILSFVTLRAKDRE